jgi:2-polyprenyl-3-methyl-5-hydroxy-6-metoxy-1,4-benzoquinol methylase
MSINGQNNFYVVCEILDRCPICGGMDLRVWRKGYDRLCRVSRQEFTYSRCLHCDVIFLSSRPAEGDAHKFYPSDYGPYQSLSAHANRNAAPGHNKKAAFQLLKRAVLKVVNGLNRATARFSPDIIADEFQKFYRLEQSGARLLDFGCGTDAYLNHARAQGWDTLGMDFSPQTIEQVRRSGHMAFLVTPSVWDKIEDESIDLARMNHVLEHLYRPREVLAALRSKMKIGAKMHIALPNPNSFTSRLFRSRWFALDCPRHVILYSPAVLTKLLEELGFSEVRVRHETITKDFSRSLGYVLWDRGWIGHEGVRQMMHRLGLAALLYTPARVAAAYGAADRFHVFARK